jgi:hypothetical protein
MKFVGSIVNEKMNNNINKKNGQNVSSRPSQSGTSKGPIKKTAKRRGRRWRRVYPPNYKFGNVTRKKHIPKKHRRKDLDAELLSCSYCLEKGHIDKDCTFGKQSTATGKIITPKSPSIPESDPKDTYVDFGDVGTSECNPHCIFEFERFHDPVDIQVPELKDTVVLFEKSFNNKVVVNLKTSDRTSLKKLLPNDFDKLEFTGGRNLHPILYTIRQVAVDRIFEKISGCKVLDVGTSLRMVRYSKAVTLHGCENGTDVHAMIKRNDKAFIRRKPGPEHFDMNGGPGFTICTCDASECICVMGYDYVTLIHSLYYVDKAKLAKLLSFTKKKMGYALVHRFNKSRDELYGELTYLRKDNKIKAIAKGNSHFYEHDNIDWLFKGKNCYVSEYGNVKWTLEPVTDDVNNYIVTFILLPSTDMKSEELVDFISFKSIEESKAENLLQMIPGLSNIELINKCFMADFQNQPVTIPVGLVTKGLQQMADKEINDKTTEALMNTLRSKLRATKGLNDDNNLLISSLLVQISDKILEVTRKNGRRKDVISYVKENSYNFFRTRSFRAALANSISTLVDRIKYYVFTCIWVPAIFYTFFQYIYGGVKHLAVIFDSLSILSLFLMLLVFINKTARSKEIPFHEQLDMSIRCDRKTLTSNGSLPYLWGPLKIDSKFKTAGLELDPDKVLIIDQDGRPVRDSQGTVAVGMNFSVVPFVYRPSQKNGVKAAITRVKVKTPKMNEELWGEGVSLFAPYINVTWDGDFILNSPDPDADTNEFKKVTKEEWLARFPVNKRTRIIEAGEKVKAGAINKKQFNYTGFVKQEKQLGFTPEDWECQKPRMIYAIDWFTKWIFGTWFYNYSICIKHLLNPKCRVWYCSGYGVDTFNKWFTDAISELGKVLFICSDFSKYDITQVLRVIIDNCKRYEKAGVKYVHDQAWKWYKEAKKYTKLYGNGFRMKFAGAQKSGDLDTSLANTINVGNSIVSFYIKHDLLDKSRIAILGDDNFTIISTDAVLKKFGSIELFQQKLTEWVSGCGFVFKCLVTEKPVYAEFLSMKFYPVDGGWAVGKKPGRCLAKIGHMLKKNDTKRDYRAMYKGTLLSYLPTSNHVPFLRKYIKIALEHLTDVNATYDHLDWSALLHEQNATIHEANVDTWDYFQETYDLDEQDESLFETELRSAIKEHGFTCYIHSEAVLRMIKTEAIL